MVPLKSRTYSAVPRGRVVKIGMVTLPPAGVQVITFPGVEVAGAKTWDDVDLGLGSELCGNELLQLFPYPGRAEEEVGAHRLQIAKQMGHALIERDDTVVQQRVGLYQLSLGNMRQWQVRQEARVLPHLKALLETVGRNDERVVGLHHAFGHTCGTGGEDQ